MRIDRLNIKNFCGFEQADFSFSPRFNLFVGINGAGKTSLLKAIAAVFSTPMAGTQHGGGWLHEEEGTARLALIEINGRTRFERCYPVRLEAAGEIVGQYRSWWVSKDGPASNANFEHTIYPVLAEEAARISQGGHGALPLCVFYPADRQWRLTGVSPDSAVRQQDSRLDGYRSWSNAALDIQGLESWIIGKSLERLEAQSFNQTSNQDTKWQDELEMVNKAVIQAVPGSTGLRYDIKYRRLMLNWQNSKPTPFDTLSDGQRGMAALVADIARRICLLNPQLGNEAFEVTPGVVIIDELDMHLHPTWQRKISSLLLNTFPRIQFFAASHSPQIIGELEPQHIWLMNGNKILGHPERSLGLDSGEVLEELMGSQARNPEIDKQVQDIRQAIDDDKLDEAQHSLTNLKQSVGDIPDVLEAQSAIDSLNWIEKENP